MGKKGCNLKKNRTYPVIDNNTYRANTGLDKAYSKQAINTIDKFY